MGHAFLNAADRMSPGSPCTKKPYKDRHDARRAMNRGIEHRGKGMVAIGTGIMNVYQCRFCGFWHLGHRS